MKPCRWTDVDLNVRAKHTTPRDVYLHGIVPSVPAPPFILVIMRKDRNIRPDLDEPCRLVAFVPRADEMTPGRSFVWHFDKVSEAKLWSKTFLFDESTSSRTLPRANAVVTERKNDENKATLDRAVEFHAAVDKVIRGK